jgi:hypothetical protein
MPGTRHEPAEAASAQIIIVRGWADLHPLEPALEKLHEIAGIPVTARLAWWRSAVMSARDATPVLLALPAPDGAISAAALVAMRDVGEGWQLASGRSHSDDVWEVAALSDDARRTVLGELAGFVQGLDAPWQLTLTGLRDDNDAAWLAGQLPDARVVRAAPVPGIGFSGDEVTLGPGIRSGLDRSGQRIR